MSCENTSRCNEDREVAGWRKSDTARYILLENNRGSRYSPNEKCLLFSRSQWLLLIAAFIITSCSILSFENVNTTNNTTASRLQIIFCNTAFLLASANKGFHISLKNSKKTFLRSAIDVDFCRQVDLIGNINGFDNLLTRYWVNIIYEANGRKRFKIKTEI